MIQIRNEKLYSVLSLSITSDIKEEGSHLTGGKAVNRSVHRAWLWTGLFLHLPEQGEQGQVSSSALTFETIKERDLMSIGLKSQEGEYLINTLLSRNKKRMVEKLLRLASRILKLL